MDSRILKYAEAFLTATAALSSDVLELLQELNKNGVRYVLIGGEAMEHHGLRESSGDIDIFVEKSLDNSQRIYKSLAEFGYPVRGLEITPDTFCDVNGKAMNAALPGHVEILVNITEIPITFEQAYALSEVHNGIHYLSLQGLANIKGLRERKELRERDIEDLTLLRQRGILPGKIIEPKIASLV